MSAQVYQWRYLSSTVALPTVPHKVTHQEVCSSPVCLGLHGPLYCTHPQCIVDNLLRQKIREFFDHMDRQIRQEMLEDILSDEAPEV